MPSHSLCTSALSTGSGLSSSAVLIGYSKPQVPHVYRIAGPPQVVEQGLPGSLCHSVALSLQMSSLGCIMLSTRGETGSMHAEPAASTV